MSETNPFAAKYRAMPDQELRAALDSYGVGWERAAWQAIVEEATRRGMAIHPRGPRVVKFRTFRSEISSWNKLFENAAAFSTEIGPENLIGISHSASLTEGVVCVWFWE